MLQENISIDIIFILLQSLLIVFSSIIFYKRGLKRGISKVYRERGITSVRLETGEVHHYCRPIDNCECSGESMDYCWGLACHIDKYIESNCKECIKSNCKEDEKE